MSNIRSIVTDLDDVCDLLQEAENLMMLPNIQPVIENAARGLAQIRAIRTGIIDTFNASDICHAAVMMTAVDPTSDIDRWSMEIIRQTNRFIQMHEVLDDPSTTPFQQAFHRLEVAREDCREMQRLRSPA